MVTIGNQEYFKGIEKIKFIPAFIALLFLNGCADQAVPESANNNKTPLFKRILSNHSGITFKNVVEEKYETFFEWFPYVYNGGGVAIGDINNDGLQDVYFTANDGSNKLYLNQGNLKFKDITESAGVNGGSGWHNGVTMVDINSDGFMDIYVCRGGWQDTDEERTNLLFVNQGDLTFKKSSAEYGLDENGYSIHAVFFDMDNDSDLDAYVMNRPDSFNLGLTQMAERAYNSPSKNRDKLYINENGKFIEKGLQSGITENYGYGLSVVAADLNQDGYTDLFVSNDFAVKDYLYINQKDGTFKEQIEDATNHISLFSMGADIADINNDGLEDLVVMEMKPEDYIRSKVSMPSMDVKGFFATVNEGQHKQYMHNMLHLNQGNLFFSEISQLSGVSKSEWSWSSLLIDLDNDGNRDLFITNGMRRDFHDGDAKMRLHEFASTAAERYGSFEAMWHEGFSEIVGAYNSIKVSNYLFKNNGDLTYENISEAWGFKDESFSHGAAIADLDNDGDLDLIVNNLEGEAFLYENKSTNNYLRINLQGPEKNPNGLGAKVAIYYDDKMQFFENKTVRGYLSSSEPIVHFGLGDVAQIDKLIVTWSDGRQNILKKVQANQILKVGYASAIDVEDGEPEITGFFTDATTSTFSNPFTHKENEFDEYRRQVLLPHMFSKSGPLVSTGDVNGDGTEDFYVGGASGQAGQLFIQLNGKFEQRSNNSFTEDLAYEDMGSSLFDADQDGDLDLLVVSGGTEYPQGSNLYQHRLYINDGQGNFSKKDLPKMISSGSCVAPYDIDGDGDLDLFIGGQVVAYQYLSSPRSYLLINENGNFVDKTEEISPQLATLGMVQAATWADITGDGKSELIVVGEWTPIHVFEYDGNGLKEISSDLGLENTEGWWNSVQTNDLDGDGDMDLVLGNIGENYKFKASIEKPFEVYVNDFDQNGTNDIFLAKHYKDRLVPIRGIECAAQQLPVLQSKFNSYGVFALANLPQILGDGIESAIHKEAYLFSSIILENDNGKLKIRYLPIEAQFSAVNSIIIEDLDGDGVNDLLIGGNKFDVEVETTPADASPGYFLKGLGNLNFKAIPPWESGFFIPYNVKDIQTIEVGGRTNILVAINDGDLKIFQTQYPLSIN